MPLSFVQNDKGQCVPQLGLSFNSKDKGRTCWLCITHKVNDPAIETLLADLETVGWKQDEFLEVYQINGVTETIIFKHGSNPFGNWTSEDRRIFMAEARDVLRRHGYVYVPVNNLTWQELV